MISANLKALFSSQTRVKLLSTFLLHPEQEFFIRELTRLLDEQINSIRRELENLRKIGLVKARQRNRKKYYRVDTDFALFTELQSMFTKEMQQDTPFMSSLKRLPDVEFILVAGALTGSDSKVDILLVGDTSADVLEALMAQDDEVRGKNLKYSIFSEADFLYRLSLGDRFIRTILDDQKNIVVLNKIQKEIEQARGK